MRIALDTNAYSAFKRKGCPIPTNDLWIAAAAMRHGQRLLTLDGYFEAVDGLLTGKALDDFLP